MQGQGGAGSVLLLTTSGATHESGQALDGTRESHAGIPGCLIKPGPSLEIESTEKARHYAMCTIIAQDRQLLYVHVSQVGVAPPKLLRDVWGHDCRVRYIMSRISPPVVVPSRSSVRYNFKIKSIPNHASPCLPMSCPDLPSRVMSLPCHDLPPSFNLRTLYCRPPNFGVAATDNPIRKYLHDVDLRGVVSFPPPICPAPRFAWCRTHGSISLLTTVCMLFLPLHLLKFHRRGSLLLQRCSTPNPIPALESVGKKNRTGASSSK